MSEAGSSSTVSTTKEVLLKEEVKEAETSTAMAALWKIPLRGTPRIVSEADLASHDGMIAYHPWSLDTQKSMYSLYLELMFEEVESTMFEDEKHIPRDLKAVIIPLILNTRGFHPYYRDLEQAEDDPGTSKCDHRFLVDLHFEATKQTMALVQKEDLFAKTDGSDGGESKITDEDWGAKLAESMKSLTLEPTDGHTEVRTMMNDKGMEILTATRRDIADPRLDTSLRRVVALLNYGPLMSPDSGWKQEIVVRTSMRIYMACCLLGTEYRYPPGSKWPGWSSGAFGECVVFWSDGYLPRWDAADLNKKRVHSGWGVADEEAGKAVDIIRITVDMSEGVNTVWFKPFSGTRAFDGCHIKEDAMGIIVDKLNFKFHLGFALQDKEDTVTVLSDRTWI